MDVRRLFKRGLVSMFSPDYVEHAYEYFKPETLTISKVWWFLRLAHEYKIAAGNKRWDEAKKNFNEHAQMPPTFEYYRDVLVSCCYGHQPVELANGLLMYLSPNKIADLESVLARFHKNSHSDDNATNERLQHSALDNKTGQEYYDEDMGEDANATGY
jgi:hypothetical protein